MRMTLGRNTARGAHGRVIGWLAWFAALNLLWLLLISAWIPEEEVLGLFAAAVAATAAEVVREQPMAG
jgi:membrane-anchored protein YejM (alkaline phosphatase superfamily)